MELPGNVIRTFVSWKRKIHSGILHYTPFCFYCIDISKRKITPVLHNQSTARECGTGPIQKLFCDCYRHCQLGSTMASQNSTLVVKLSHVSRRQCDNPHVVTTQLSKPSHTENIVCWPVAYMQYTRVGLQGVREVCLTCTFVDSTKKGWPQLQIDVPNTPVSTEHLHTRQRNKLYSTTGVIHRQMLKALKKNENAWWTQMWTALTSNASHE